MWILALAAFGMILGLTLQSARGTTALSDWCRDALLKILPEGSGAAAWAARNIRRLGHVPEYFLLGVTAYGAMQSSFPGKKVILRTLAVCAAVSAGDECLKAMLPTRHFDILDMPMDVIGYALGTALGWAIWKTGKRRGNGNV